MIERACRVGAVLIAVLAVIDPGWLRATAVRPEVVVSSTEGATPGDLARVRDALAPQFSVRDEESPQTAARVVVGRRAPASVPDGPVFAVVTAASREVPEIRRVVAPASTAIEAAVTIEAVVAVPGPAPLEVWIESAGLALDRRVIEPGEKAEVAASLTFVPARTGLSHVRVAARQGDGPATYADTTIEVVRRTRRVLVHETQPSWMATFVRRALEDDPRLQLTTRAQVSRGVVAQAGAPPATLDADRALEGYDAIVIGVPEGLSSREVAALERYLRLREGAVILLPSGAEGAGPALPSLTGARDWRVERRPALERITSESGQWSAAEFLWPSVWPPGAEMLSGCQPAAPRCAVWRVPQGAGRVVVGSALDGWRTRGHEGSAFDAFWRRLVSHEAAMTPDPVTLTLDHTLVEPGQLIQASVHTSIEALEAEWQDTEGRRDAVRLWPDGPGRLTGQFRASSVPGRYRLVVRAASGTPSIAREWLVLDPANLARPVGADAAPLAALAAAHQGASVGLNEVDALPARMVDMVGVSREEQRTRPMRSPWWTAPFAGLLAVEWWLRRRRGAR